MPIYCRLVIIKYVITYIIARDINPETIVPQIFYWSSIVLECPFCLLLIPFTAQMVSLRHIKRGHMTMDGAA